MSYSETSGFGRHEDDLGELPPASRQTMPDEAYDRADKKIQDMLQRLEMHLAREIVEDFSLADSASVVRQPEVSAPEMKLNPTWQGIFNYVREYGPVDMRDIITGGRRTGLVTAGQDNEAITMAVHKMLDAHLLEYTTTRRVRIVQPRP